MNILKKIFNLLYSYIETLLSFSVIQIAQIVLPLLSFPYLARILEPNFFGILMYMGIFVVVFNMIMEWGISLGGARKVSQNRDNNNNLTDILGSIFTAKILLALFCFTISLIIFPFLTHALNHSIVYFLAVICGIIKGFNPTWFFQGIGNSMKKMAIYDVISSFLVFLLTIILVKSPKDWYIYFVLLALIKGCAYSWLNFDLFKQFSCKLNLKKGLLTIKETSILFCSTLFAIVYNNGSQLILGHFLLPMQMGILIIVDKIIRAAISVGKPIIETLYPEICSLHKNQFEKSKSILQLSLIIMAILMCTLSIIIWFFAPFLINIALGKGYENAVPIMRIIAFLAPLLGINFVLGTQTLVALGHEKALIKVQFFTSCCSIPLAIFLANTGNLYYVAFLNLITESLIFLGLLYSIYKLCPNILFKKSL